MLHSSGIYFLACPCFTSGSRDSHGVELHGVSHQAGDHEGFFDRRRRVPQSRQLENNRNHRVLKGSLRSVEGVTVTCSNSRREKRKFE